MEVYPGWSSNPLLSESLTELQTRTLKRIFEICQRPSNYVIGVIARQMDLSETSVKEFFDDAVKHQKSSSSSSSKTSTSKHPTFKMRLDFE